ncbi:MAG TPA: polymer-forming cytoskeletal protein [Vicinamibacterales bacterium]|jgi:cytoskeletal protein CcmA (bactofilin family)|nr:polymer-forming cytoskeletal protein [Vicinamibacterales bacterium]
MPAQDIPRPESVSEERRATAWIGQGVIVEGRITSAQDLRIDGKVEGTIEVGNHGLILGANAAVKANLVAKSILISGAVVGNVTATDRLDLQATGSVEGDIRSPRLVVADGAVIKGKIDTGDARRQMR